MATLPLTRNEKISTITHPLDIYNPAEFFASLGLLTALSLQHPDAEMFSHFVISGHQGDHNAVFVIGSLAELSLQQVITDLASAQVNEDRNANVWRNREENPKLISPVIVSANGWSTVLDWWLDDLRWRSGLLKLWSGNSSPLEMLKVFIKLVKSGTDLVNAGGTLFGFDTRVSRDAMGMGYSKKDTGEKAGVYPLTELLSALGLQRYRPRRREYYAWQKPIPLSITHAAAVQEMPGIGQRLYVFDVQKIGQGAKQALRSRSEQAVTN